MIVLNKRSNLVPNALTPAERQALVLSVQGLIYLWAGRTARRYGLPMDELASAGQLGAAWAARHFRPDRGVLFGSYAGAWIKQQIGCELEARRLAGFTRTGHAGDAGWRPALVEPTAAIAADGAALHETAPGREPEPDGRRLDWETLVAPLTARQRAVVTLTHVAGLSRREVAAALGTSRQYVEQVERRVASKIRKLFPRLVGA